MKAEKTAQKQDSKTPSPSNGAIFKKRHGYSKTLKRLLHKYGLSIEEYRQIRRERKLKEKKVRQEKHKASKLYRQTHKRIKQPGEGKKNKNNAKGKSTST